MSTKFAPPLVVVATRSGKTSSTTAPALLDRDGPATVFSRKGGQA